MIHTCISTLPLRHTHTHTHYVGLPGDKLTIPTVRKFSSLLGLQYRNHSQARKWGGKETSDTPLSPHPSPSWTGPWGLRVRESACPWVSISKPSMRGWTKPFFYHKRMFPKDIVYAVAINLSNFFKFSSWNLSKWMGQSWEHVNVIFSLFAAIVGTFS